MKPSFHTTRACESTRDLLTAVTNRWYGSTATDPNDPNTLVSQYGYTNDPNLGLRIELSRAGEAFTVSPFVAFREDYTYNARNELTKSDWYDPNGTAVDPNDLSYEYDPIGNRTQIKVGTGLWEPYCTNELNQYEIVGARCPIEDAVQRYSPGLGRWMSASQNTFDYGYLLTNT